MIERYSTEEMRRIWSQENRYSKWLEVEIAACEAWNRLGLIPDDSLERIRERASFDPIRIAEIEKEVEHDVIAFVQCVAERVGEDGRFVHMGLTSYDVVDTANALLLRESLEVLRGELSSLLDCARDLARRYKHTPCVGRTHGVHAEPMTFGLKVLNWCYEMERDLARLSWVEEEISVGKVSGAVGTYAHCPPEVESYVCEKLGLKPAKVSNQILQRDSHAVLTSVLAVLMGTLERIATEIRHLQRTEVLEALEPFKKGQKGSSAMPHKKNPVMCERICGLARLMRGYAAAALENQALWHERDISHSSVERVIWPDAFNLVHYSLRLTRRVLEGLVVDQERMARNLDLTRGLLFSQRVMLALVERGMDRKEAYELVQGYSMRCWEEGKDLRELLEGDDRVRALLGEDLARLFDASFFLRHVDEVFSRFGL